MTLDLDTIQKMWEQDSKIDVDNLHTESLNIPSLHAKYFEIYNNIILLKKKAEQQKKNIRHERYEYFSGKADPDVYVENPFPKKIRDKETLQKYLDAADEFGYDVKIETLDPTNYSEDFIRELAERQKKTHNVPEQVIIDMLKRWED